MIYYNMIYCQMMVIDYNITIWPLYGNMIYCQIIHITSMYFYVIHVNTGMIDLIIMDHDDV
jgi:hypothetical protein